jgi:hypothetical protein
MMMMMMTMHDDDNDDDDGEFPPPPPVWRPRVIYSLCGDRGCLTHVWRWLRQLGGYAGDVEKAVIWIPMADHASHRVCGDRGCLTLRMHSRCMPHQVTFGIYHYDLLTMPIIMAVGRGRRRR